MRILLKRTSAVINGELVQMGSNNIVEPRTTGTPLGVASHCRSVQIQNSPDDPVETYDVCDVTIDGDCQALLSGSASSAGGALYATSAGRLSVTVSGDVVARLAPRAMSDTTDYADGDLVNIVMCGE